MSTIQDLETQAISVPDRAKGMTVKTAEDYMAAGELLKTIKGIRAEIDATFDPIIEKAHASHKEAISQKRKVEMPLAEAEAILKPRIAAWMAEQERLRKEAEMLAQRKAQEEAERLQLEEAALLHEIGETELANSRLEEKPLVAPVILPKSVPKVTGVSMTKRYSAVVVSLMDLIKAVAAGKVPIQAVKADEVFLNRQAVAMKDALQYPGVRVHVDNNISARR